MKKIEFLNKFMLQFLFIRLTRTEQRIFESITIDSFDIMENGGISSRGRGKAKTYEWYSIQYWIKPFTGWNTPFVFLNEDNKPKFKNVTKKKLKYEKN